MSSKRPYRTCNQYCIGLITALAIELAAVTAMLDDTHDSPQDFDAASDDNNYRFGRIGSHNVVIASLPARILGKVSAATTAAQMANSFPLIRFGLFVGIGGGVPDLDLEQDIRLGDVVVGVPGGTSGGIVQYDLGKVTTQGFKRTGTLAKPPKKLLAGVQSLQAKHEAEDSRIPALIGEVFARCPRLKGSISNPKFSFQGTSIWSGESFLSSIIHHEIPEMPEIMGILLFHGADIGLALSVLRRDDARREVLAAAGVGFALRRRCGTASLESLSEVTRRELDAIAIAMEWQ